MNPDLDIEKIKAGYDRNGFAVVQPGLDVENCVKELRARIFSIFDLVAKHHGYGRIKNSKDIIDLYRSNCRDLWLKAHSVLERLPEQNAIASHPDILNLAKSLGIKVPSFSAPHEVRCDMPNDPEFGKCTVHQDAIFSYASSNALTLWIPLVDVDQAIGCLKIGHGSHKYGFFLNNNGVMETFPDDMLDYCPMKLREVLFFDHFTVHRSGKNTKEDHVRMSLQFRFTDLADNEYLDRNYHYHSTWSRKPTPRQEEYPQLYANYDQYFSER